MTVSQEEIIAHNRRTMWNDAANHLRVALEAIEHAQEVMDDLNVPHIADNMVPVVDGVRRFRDLAVEKATE